MLIVGPSGAGKDTLLGAVREQLGNEPALVFAERVVTRPNQVGMYTHVEMLPLEFDLKRETGQFGLDWVAHGNRYGVPIEAFSALDQGRTVVVNASRSVVEYAREQFSPVRIVHVTASAQTLRARLHARGREAEADIDRRLERAQSLRPCGDDVVELLNEGDLTANAQRFAAILRDAAGLTVNSGS